MLNTNKIESLINYAGSNASKVAKATGIPYTSIKTKIERKSWSPNDIEKLADYFNKPISYFFDREETPDKAEDKEALYQRRCLQCEEKDRLILELNAELRETSKKLIDRLEQERGDDLNGEVQEAKVS